MRSLSYGLALALVGWAASTPAPRPRAARVLAPTFFPGWQARQVAFPFVLHEGGGYVMYFAGAATEQFNDSAWDQWVTGRVTSPDGRKWRYPDDYQPALWARAYLEGELLGPPAARPFDAVSAFGVSVIHDAGEHRMWYTGWRGEDEPAGEGLARPIGFRIGYATSADGIRWTKRPGSAGDAAVFAPGPPGAADAKGVAQPYVLRDADGYRMWYEGFDGGAWRILRATSRDGLSWTREGVALDLGAADAPDQLGLRNPVVIRRDGRYELWYQGEGRGDPAFRVLRATSRDGLQWRRAGEVPLHPEPPVTGSERLHVDSVLVAADGRCQVFFAKENPVTHTGPYGAVTSRAYSIYSETADPR